MSRKIVIFIAWTFLVLMWYAKYFLNRFLKWWTSSVHENIKFLITWKITYKKIIQKVNSSIKIFATNSTKFKSNKLFLSLRISSYKFFESFYKFKLQPNSLNFTYGLFLLFINYSSYLIFFYWKTLFSFLLNSLQTFVRLPFRNFIMLKPNK